MNVASPTYQDLSSAQDMIEALAAQRQSPVRVRAGRVYDTHIEFECVPLFDRGATVAKIRAMAVDLALQLRAPSVRMVERAGAIAMCVPRSGAPVVTMDALLAMQAQWPTMTAVLGVAPDSATQAIRFSRNRYSHALVCGKSRSGKSTLADTMLISLCRTTTPSDLRIVFIDPQNSRSLGRSSEWLFSHIGRHVWASALRHNEIEGALQKVARALRNPEPRRVGAQGISTLVFIDELHSVVSQSPACAEIVAEIVTTGGKFGYHLIACAQSPGRAPIAGMIAGNFQVRLVTSMADALDAYHATGRKSSGAEHLGQGQFIAVYDAAMDQFRAALPPEGEGAAPVALITSTAPAPMAAPMTAQVIARVEDPADRVGADAVGADDDTDDDAEGAAIDAETARATADVSPAMRRQLLQMIEADPATAAAVLRESGQPAAAAMLEKLAAARTAPAEPVTAPAHKPLAEWTLAERVQALRAWNPAISISGAQKALAPGGKAGGFYAIQDVWGGAPSAGVGPEAPAAEPETTTTPATTEATTTPDTPLPDPETAVGEGVRG